MILAFGDIEIDPGKGEIRRGGTRVPAAPRVISLLHLLASNADRMVTKGEIVEKIWDGRAISDAAISTSIKEVRQAVGDSGSRQEIVRTMHGLGFRCVAVVKILPPAVVVSGALKPAPGELPGPNIFAGKPSVAVLPFANVTSAVDADPLGDGLAAELISALSRLHYISVIARGSSFRFRQIAPDLAAISQILGVRYCLTGLVESDGAEIAVTVELARTADSVIIWSDRFTGPRERVHEIRSKIVAEVITGLELHVPLHEAQAARLLAPNQLDAWAEYHIGLQHLYRFNPHDNSIAKARFENAIAREPGFARAHAGLSFVAFQNVFMGYGADPAHEQQEAQVHAEKSLELDLLDPFGNYCMARAKWMTGELETADNWLGRSLEISPNFAQGHYLRSLVRVMLGQGKPIREGNNLAMALSPLDPLFYAMLGTQAQSFINDEEFDQAAQWGDSAAQAPGSHYLLAMVAAAAQELKGDHARARYWVQNVRRRRSDATVARYFQAFPYQSGEMRQRMERALRDAGF